MNKRQVEKLYNMVKEIKCQCCDKYPLQVSYGACCYDTGGETMYCPFDDNGRCLADSFTERLEFILSMKGESKASKY